MNLVKRQATVKLIDRQILSTSFLGHSSRASLMDFVSDSKHQIMNYQFQVHMNTVMGTDPIWNTGMVRCGVKKQNRKEADSVKKLVHLI